MNFRPQNTQSAQILRVHRMGALRELSCATILCIPCNLWSNNSRRIEPRNTQSARSECPGENLEYDPFDRQGDLGKCINCSATTWTRRL